MKTRLYVDSRCIEIRSASDGSEPVARREDSALRLLMVLASDPRARASLRRLLAEASPSSAVAHVSDEALVREWADLITRGRFRIAELQRVDVVGRQTGEREEEESTPPPLERREVRTWIEIQMIGEDDLPIPDERYAIELPDGTRREGRLDSKGLARVDGIDPGKCVITFPALDEEAWVRA